MKVAVRDENHRNSESIKGVINTGIQVQHIARLSNGLHYVPVPAEASWSTVHM